MKPLISDEVNDGLNKIVQKLFEGNRIMDRAMSVLNIKFVMNKTVEQLHPKLAHLYPKLADVISDYQGARNMLTIYGLTPEDKTDYISPLDFFERLLDYMHDLESIVIEVSDVARENGDITTKIFLENFLITLIPVTNQSLLLVDKGELYEKDWMAFDHRIEDFIVLE